MTAMVTNGVSATASNTSCAYSATLPSNLENFQYYTKPNGNCGIKINYATQNWYMSQINQVIDKAGIKVKGIGDCSDLDSLYLAIKEMIRRAIQEEELGGVSP